METPATGRAGSSPVNTSLGVSPASNTTASITDILDQFEGKPLNSPNDIMCKSDGTIWLTDPAFGPNPYEAMAKPERPGNVYCIDPNTKQATAVHRERDSTVRRKKRSGGN